MDDIDTPVFTNPYLGYILLAVFVIYVTKSVIEIKNEGRLLNIGFLVVCQLALILGSFWLIDNDYSIWIVPVLGLIGTHLFFTFFEVIFKDKDKK